MYLFYRSARLSAGDARDQLSWAFAITEKVNHIVETPVNLWTTVFSPGVNTLTWTTVGESVALLEANMDKLMADGSYLDLVAQGAQWDSHEAMNDGLLQLLDPDPAATDAAAAYTGVVSAVLAPGQFARGIEVGIGITHRVRQATKVPTHFSTAMTGRYGEVCWITGYDSIAQYETSEQELYGDGSLISYLDSEAREAFLPGATAQTLYRRLV